MAVMKTLIAVIFLCASSLASAAINVCVDADGKKTFTDQSCSKLSLKDITPVPLEAPRPVEPVPKPLSSGAWHGHPMTIDLPDTSKAVENNEHNVLVNIWAAGAKLDWPMRFFIVGFLFPMFFILSFYLFDFLRRRLSVKAAAKP